MLEIIKTYILASIAYEAIGFALALITMLVIYKIRMSNL